MIIFRSCFKFFFNQFLYDHWQLIVQEIEVRQWASDWLAYNAADIKRSLTESEREREHNNNLDKTRKNFQNICNTR